MEQTSKIHLLQSLSTIADPPLSKSQLKKLAKQAKKPKKEKVQWNAPNSKNEKKINLDEGSVFINKTPFGQKKDVSLPLSEKYNSDAVEASWDAWWEKSGFYHVDAEEAKNLKPEEKFIMVIPPPNVTGSLHIGHALMITVEDVLARYNRMLGKKVLWVPGTDHAGIGTQAVVEAKLFKTKGLTKNDIGREAFLKLVWEWVDEKGGKILEQIRRMGVSVDHSRTVFTLDDTRSKAVSRAFVEMFDMGLIYRKKRLVNWSSALKTAIADIEVDPKEIPGPTMLYVKSHNAKFEFGVIQDFHYVVADASGNPTDEKITVATTRLETMLGDSGVAIHPEDTRYTHLHGKSVIHPFFKRLIPVVLDAELVDMEFGTACVKITPAHDQNDYNCAVKHNLPMMNMLADDGTIDTSELGEVIDPSILPNLHGMMRYEARVQVAAALEKLGLLGEKRANKMSLPICSKSGDIVEPRLKEQWWVDTEEMSANAIKAVDEGDLKIIPSFHVDTWKRFLTNPHQWCISRQLWWGHRIPAFLAKDASGVTLGWFVAETESEAKKKAAEAHPGVELTLEQDEDVLDTWFSSGLFPFSVFGWPEKSADLDSFFPNSLLETGHDILFFWVARMVMMSQTLMGKLPFDTVYLHAIVRDRLGRKMSKSLGNVVDPLAVINGCTLAALNESILTGNLPQSEVKKALRGQKEDFPDGIPKCGSDALRFGLLANISQGRDVNLDINNIFSTRKFCNKLWNLTRFCLTICESLEDNRLPFEGAKSFQDVPTLELAERDYWILNELTKVVSSCEKTMAAYNFADLTSSVMTFWTAKLCDVYVESMKPVVKSGHEAKRDEPAEIAKLVCLLCLDSGLKLFHPVMPFLTEELWQHLPTTKAKATVLTTIMNQKYPTVKDPVFAHFASMPDDMERKVNMFEVAVKVAQEMRSLKADFKIPNLKKDTSFKLYVDESRLQYLNTQTLVSDMETLGFGKISIHSEDTERENSGTAVSVLDGHMQLEMNLLENVDVTANLKKLNKERSVVESSKESLNKKLSNKKFLEKAPKSVLEESKVKINDLDDQLKKIILQIEQLQSLK